MPRARASASSACSIRSRSRTRSRPTSSAPRALPSTNCPASVQRWLNTLSGNLGGNETLGTTENLLEGVEPAIRGRETALGNLLADAARQQMQTDVAVINGGSIR